jgi:hypothetical protein
MNNLSDIDDLASTFAKVCDFPAPVFHVDISV